MKRIYVLLFSLLVCMRVHITHPDIAQFLKYIIGVEDMLDGIKPLDIARAQADLKLLKDTTTSPNRIERINDAYRRLNALQDEVRNREPKADMELQVPLDIVPQLPSLEEKTSEQKLEALLLYTRSLLATADVDIKVEEKDQARAHMDRAVTVAIPLMQGMLSQNPSLAGAFAKRVQELHARAVRTQKEINAMQ